MVGRFSSGMKRCVVRRDADVDDILEKLSGKNTDANPVLLSED